MPTTAKKKDKTKYNSLQIAILTRKWPSLNNSKQIKANTNNQSSDAPNPISLYRFDNYSIRSTI